MTTLVWIGGTGSFDDPNEWSPSGVPRAGDTAIISIGTATLSMQKLDGFELQLQSPASVLDISDVIFGKNFVLNAPAGAGGTATLNATGFDANLGLILVGTVDQPFNFSPPFTINMSDLAPSPGCSGAAAIFVNSGTIQDVGGQPFAIVAQSPDATLINNGTIDLAATNTRVTIGVAVQGSGTISTGEVVIPVGASADLLSTVPLLEFGGAVGSGQTLDIVGSAYVLIDKPSQFHALIEGFAPLPSSTSPPPYWYGPFEPHIILENAPVTSYAVANDVLTLWDNGSIVAQLRFTGYDYTKANFSVTTSGTTTTIEPQGTLAPMGVAAHGAAAEHALIS